MRPSFASASSLSKTKTFSRATPFAKLMTSLCVAVVCSIPVVAFAAEEESLKVKISKRGEMAAHQVVFAPFSGDSDLSNTILGDLQSTSLTVTSEGLIEEVHSSAALGNSLPAWQQLGIPYLVVGNSRTDGSRATVSFEVIDLFTGEVKLKDNVAGNNRTEVAHEVAGRIYQALTGKPDDFDARIVYVEEKGVGKDQTSALMMRDADGNNPRQLDFVQDATIFSPVASPDGRTLVYAVQLKNMYPILYKRDLTNNSVTKLVNLNGGQLSPSFSADGRYIVFSSTADGDADIYRVSSSGGQPQKIIDLPYDQVTPSYAADGSVIFASDHTNPNNPSIYRYTANSGAISRLSRGGYATSPAVSPDGTKIGYLSGRNAAVMSINGAPVTNFGNTGIDEAPRFSPSSERVVYAQGSGPSSIIIRPLSGGKSIRKQADGAVKSPIWVPATR